MKTIKFSGIPTLKGVCFSLFGRCIQFDRIQTSKITYFKVVVAVGAGQATLLGFRYSNTIEKELESALNAYVACEGYVNVAKGFYLVVNRMHVFEEEDHSDPLFQIDLQKVKSLCPLKKIVDLGNEIYEPARKIVDLGNEIYEPAGLGNKLPQQQMLLGKNESPQQLHAEGKNELQKHYPAVKNKLPQQLPRAADEAVGEHKEDMEVAWYGA